MVSEVKKSRGACVIPALRYRDAQGAIEWLCKAFGFEKKMVVPGEDGRVAHAELVLGNSMIMLGDAESDYSKLVAAPVKGSPVSQGLYVVVPDADAHFERAKAEGGEILMPLKTQDYGGRDYTCRDPGGYVWTFGTYDPWVS
jgi:uncharacterized glyoxalase superfamily protein PhnB